MCVCVCLAGSTDAYELIPARELQVVRLVHPVDAVDVQRWRIRHEPQFNSCRNQQDTSVRRTALTVNGDDIISCTLCTNTQGFGDKESALLPKRYTAPLVLKRELKLCQRLATCCVTVSPITQGPSFPLRHKMAELCQNRKQRKMGLVRLNRPAHSGP